MPQRGEPVVRLLARRAARHPQRRIDAPQIERRRIAAQRFLALLVAVLVEIGQRQFAQTAVDRITVAQHGAVGLGDRAPTAAATK